MAKLIKKLYIPIWFYSNSVFASDGYQPSLLYIPIWFYSNEQAENIKRAFDDALHSNLVLF